MDAEIITNTWLIQYLMTQIIVTNDGSHTLLDENFNEHYHSVHGAIGESEYIFIEQGLKKVLKPEIHEESVINIFEVGFGTGLNAFLTLLFVKNTNFVIKYTSIEKSPLDSSIWQSLNYPDCLNPVYKEDFEQLHQVDWNKIHIITPSFTLLKVLADLEAYSFNKKYDLVYFDAFSPKSQPELWSEKIFRKINDNIKFNGVLVTYSASGQVRRNLINSGFLVEKIKGPLNKRHMLRAIKIS